MPPRPAGRNVASETEAPLNLWVAIWLCSVLDCHQDFKLWIVVPPLLPERRRGCARWERIANRAVRRLNRNAGDLAIVVHDNNTPVAIE